MFPRLRKIVLLVGCASALAARAACAQSAAQLSITKAQDFKQTSTATPVPVTNPFSFAAGVSTSFTLSSANVTPPGGSTITLTGSGTSWRFGSNPFASISALNAAFPNGTYTFNLQTAAGAPITSTVTINGDGYPAAPQLTNNQWIGSGALEFNPTAQFTFSWTTPAVSVKAITFTIKNPSGTVVFNPTVSNTSSSLAMPANTLTAGVIYTAQLAFANTTTTQSTVGGATITSIANYTSEITFTINPVTAPPNIATPTGIALIQGQPIAYQLAATTIANATLDTSSLPGGLSWDPTTGIIFGTPTASGTFQPSYTITNAAGTNGGIVTLSAASPPPGPAFANATSATGRVGVPFSFQLTTTGASTAVKFSASNLPAGLTINTSSGLISGTVNTAGSTAVNVTLTDGSATRTSTLQLTFVSDVVTPVITSPKIVTLYPGQNFSYQISAAYGPSRVDEPSFAVYGKLPTGLNFDPKTGIISGVFGGQLQRNSDPPDRKFLNDSPLVQLAGTNTHGTGTSPLIFLAAPTGTVNLSTRMFVGTNDDVLIGGFIITGTASEKLLLRGIGPSLPVSGALQDPVLELHLGDGTLQAQNDNWQDDATQAQAIKDTGVPPSNPTESALVATFQPANFTAIVSGKNGATGIGLVELFDLGTQTTDTSQHAKLAQISTRGTVRTGDNVMIGGFIVQGVATKVLLRGIGPELTAKGVAGALQDTFLELHSGDGTLIASNDNWQDDATQAQAIQTTGVAPTDPRESALIATLNPGSYTAVLRGKNDTSGVALVEVYNLQ